MKKHLGFYFLCVQLLLPTLACAPVRNEQTRIATPYSTLQIDTLGEDFDFAPLPTTRSALNGVWDDTDVDISKIDTNRKLISFTFDDAPASTLESILAVFANYNENNPDCVATATLFCNGKLYSETAHNTLLASVTLGWELGNHTYSHADITKIPIDELQSEIRRTESILSKIDGKSAHLFRAPYGRINETTKREIGAPIIDWTIDTLDWTGVSAEDIYNEVFTQKFSGAIVLMHDGYPNTVTALKRLLPDLKEAGYQVTSVSQMAKAHACTLKNGSAYIRARKQGNG